MLTIKHTLTLFALFLFGASVLVAQPTLQNNVFPSTGQAITTAEASDSNAVSEGASGANITWNFSVLQAASGTVSTTNFQSPAGTPFEPLFPTANLCGVVFDTENLYTYLQKSSSELKFLGIGSADFSITLSNPQTVLKAPMAFNGSFSDTYWGTIDAGLFAITTYGESESTYDAYGTLIMPTTTYTNAIRVKTESTTRDTFDFGGGLLNITVLNTTTYSWFKADVPWSIVDISYSEGESISVIPGLPPSTEIIDLSKSISFTSGFSTGVVEVPTLDGISLAFRGANPVADVLALDIETATAGETLQLQVFSRNGQLVSTQNITTNGATLSVDVNVTDCRPGLYYVSLTDGAARLSKGFVKM